VGQTPPRRGDRGGRLALTVRRLLLHTRRQGPAGSLGHDLTIEVTRWSAEVEVGADLPTGHVSARVDEPPCTGWTPSVRRRVPLA
jgi:hypothetical protein